MVDCFSMSDAENVITSLLSKAGITVDGQRPWDIQVHDERFYTRFIKENAIGFGNSYIDGWWDSFQLDETIARIISARVYEHLHTDKKLFKYFQKQKAFRFDIERHHDIGNELFEAMLDPGMNYSCGYWKNLGNLATAWQIPKNLRIAQEAKLELIAKKLQIKRDQQILDIGCGWGNFVKYITSHYRVKATGITGSKKQAVIAKKRCKGLPVKILLQDYRQLGEIRYDKITSVGMFEHVTHKHYASFMKIVANSLKQDGLFLLQTIGTNKTSVSTNPWTEKYIFSNAQIPSLTQISQAIEGLFITEDVQNFGAYYYPTLLSWHRNFNKNWKKLAATNFERYNERFYRMWKYYLLSSAGYFKVRELQVWQFVFSKKRSLEVYTTAR
jgi:cyclopropane-fatty-acyl-phospholipid synthase